MRCKVYFGNLPYSCTSDDLKNLVSELGYDPASAKVVLDDDSGRSKGFGFVEFRTPQAAAEAIRDLNGHVHKGRPLRAAEAVVRGGRASWPRGRLGGRLSGGAAPLSWDSVWRPSDEEG